MVETVPHVELICEGRPPIGVVCPMLCQMGAKVEHFDEQLQLASQVQRDLLPNPLPLSTTARFHALYLPADHVSGDIYDVVRLDESHLAVSLADATGHGMPAALLTVLIKRLFRGKTIENGSYRILEPDEVLAGMNREFLDMNLSQSQFVTGSHAIYDEQRRLLRWARGGLPHPMLVPRDGPPILLRSTGVLLGAVENPIFDVVEQPLRPGDVMYFYTDGLDALLCRKQAGDTADDLSATPWFRTLRGRSPGDVLAEIAAIDRDTPPETWPCDDISVVCVECSD